MLPLAHFTPAELPGTLAILLFGVTLGAAATLRRRDSLTLAIVGFCGLVAVGSVVDHFEGIGQGVRTAVDAIFLIGAADRICSAGADANPTYILAV